MRSYWSTQYAVSSSPPQALKASASTGTATRATSRERRRRRWLTAPPPSVFVVDLAQGGDDLGVRDLRAQLLQLGGHDRHHVLDVVVELRGLVLVGDARLADLVGQQPVRIATEPMPPAITNAASQRPRKLSGE